MYRVPNEHFSEIADIASQPEAPKVNFLLSQNDPDAPNVNIKYFTIDLRRNLLILCWLRLPKCNLSPKH